MADVISIHAEGIKKRYKDVDYEIKYDEINKRFTATIPFDITIQRHGDTVKEVVDTATKVISTIKGI